VNNGEGCTADELKLLPDVACDDGYSVGAASYATTAMCGPSVGDEKAVFTGVGNCAKPASENRCTLPSGYSTASVACSDSVNGCNAVTLQALSDLACVKATHPLGTASAKTATCAAANARGELAKFMNVGSCSKPNACTLPAGYKSPSKAECVNNGEGCTADELKLLPDVACDDGYSVGAASYATTAMCGPSVGDEKAVFTGVGNCAKPASENRCTLPSGYSTASVACSDSVNGCKQVALKAVSDLACKAPYKGNTTASNGTCAAADARGVPAMFSGIGDCATDVSTWKCKLQVGFVSDPSSCQRTSTGCTQAAARDATMMNCTKPFGVGFPDKSKAVCASEGANFTNVGTCTRPQFGVEATVKIEGLSVDQFTANAQTAFKEVVANNLTACGSSGSEVCTSMDVTIVKVTSSRRAALTVKFKVATHTLAASQTAKAGITNKIGSTAGLTAFIAALKAKPNLSFVTSVTQVGSITTVTPAPTSAPTSAGGNSTPISSGPSTCRFESYIAFSIPVIALVISKF